ncbi:AraC family transcriptional regulator [Anaerovorax odorimutans]|uniref:AraC family transcriptional regulator n=1 Tax=Anaerovorax odorimutans TaxID=109327 RepID=A0ABT1RP94_9FIRM|nr:AraC family transcriptional regulator [Anaerovorax odorimutans]MCQ4637007.1 AraC family transcriptional regulator [Anaerovorax odorimutans]
MLETILYEKDLAVDVKIGNVREYPLHYNDDLQLIYVVAGSIDLKLTGNIYHLSENDIHIIARGDVHGIVYGSDNNIALCMSFNSDVVLDKFPDLHNQTFTTRVDKNLVTYQKKIELLNDIFTILSLLHKADEGYQTGIYHAASNLISNLYENFRGFHIDAVDKTFEHTVPADAVQIDRINRIVDYIYTNAPYKLTLDEIADAEHLNRYYLSHMFSRFTGQSFKNFLGMARAENSEIPLLESDVSITQLSENVGFSKPKYYMEHFSKWYGMAPKEYRRTYRSRTLDYSEPVVTSIPLSDLNSFVHNAAFSAFSETSASQKQIDLSEPMPGFAEKSGQVLPPVIDVETGCLADRFLDDLYISFYKGNMHFQFMTAAGSGAPVNENAYVDSYRRNYSATKELEHIIQAISGNQELRLPFFDTGDLNGLVTLNGLVKPAFYLVRFVGQDLQGQIVYKDENLTITEREGDFSLMAWNNKQRGALSYKVTFPLRASHYQMTVQSFSDMFYDLWRKLGFAYDLTDKDRQRINEGTGLHSDFELIDNQKTFTFELEIPAGEFRFGSLEVRA